MKEHPKIAIIGYAGSGKSTLAAFLSERFSVPVLYVDTIHFLPNWVERKREDELSVIRSFLDENSENGWVIDGNYTKLEYDRRMAEADLIVFMDFNRINCLMRAWKRARRFKGKTRPSMTVGCDEKFDHEFRMWMLRDGRKKEVRNRFKALVNKYREKTVVIKDQRQLDRFKNSFGSK
ncbi:MAG: DNA topology modulation protein FlaR [Clostridia bacterium]|nr:DNA topology modulation protein FlaR [Clostridia bacterium]